MRISVYSLPRDIAATVWRCPRAWVSCWLRSSPDGDTCPSGIPSNPVIYDLVTRQARHFPCVLGAIPHSLLSSAHHTPDTRSRPCFATAEVNRDAPGGGESGC